MSEKGEAKSLIKPIFQKCRLFSAYKAHIQTINKKGLEANRLKTLEFTGGASLIRTGDLRIMIPSL